MLWVTIDLSQTTEDQERQATELHDRASSIILECKKSRPVSTVETAIFLLRSVLDQQPSAHPLRFYALRHLSIALLTRFNQWGWVEDCREALEAMVDAVRSFGTVEEASAVFSEANVR
jgi:hypothetical protein